MSWAGFYLFLALLSCLLFLRLLVLLVLLPHEVQHVFFLLSTFLQVAVNVKSLLAIELDLAASSELLLLANISAEPTNGLQILFFLAVLLTHAVGSDSPSKAFVLKSLFLLLELIDSRTLLLHSSLDTSHQLIVLEHLREVVIWSRDCNPALEKAL